MPDPSYRHSTAKSVPSNHLGGGGTGFIPVRLPPEQTLSGAARLISDGSGSKQQAAKRMLSAAAIHGIDLSMMWGTVDRHPDGRIARIREVCLAVPGSGRTSVLLLGDPSGPGSGHMERVGCINAACGFLGALPDGEIRLAQTLPEPQHAWSVEAFSDAGFMKVGDLAYMRRGVQPLDHPAKQDWPDGITVRNVRGLGPRDEDRALIIEALDRSYLETLDCPELCGMRETVDVLESHRATGEWHPRLWWLVFKHGQPQGCVLFNRVPDQGSVELVYLGHSPDRVP